MGAVVGPNVFRQSIRKSKVVWRKSWLERRFTERRQTFTPVSHPITNIAGRLEGQSSMAQCEVCGNDYDKSFSVEANGRKHVFDSFECAIQALAPACSQCRCRIIGHGVEGGGQVYCCANCARQAGVSAVVDRVA
jgi:hypothetical protein